MVIDMKYAFWEMLLRLDSSKNQIVKMGSHPECHTNMKNEKEVCLGWHHIYKSQEQQTNDSELPSEGIIIEHDSESMHLQVVPSTDTALRGMMLKSPRGYEPVTFTILQYYIGKGKIFDR